MAGTKKERWQRRGRWVGGQCLSRRAGATGEDKQHDIPHSENRNAAEALPFVCKQ